MIAVELQTNIDILKEKMRKYGELSGKSEADVIRKQAGKLGYAIKQGLADLKPQKGQIRAERLAALASGEGIYVRPAAYESVAQKYGKAAQFGKRFTSVERKGSTLNFQALAVQKEINLRESGRGFMAYSAQRARSFDELAHLEIESRYGEVLSIFDVDLRPEAEHKFVRFDWQTGSPALEGLNKDQQMAVINNAIGEVAADIQVYIDKHLGDVKSEAGL